MFVEIIAIGKRNPIINEFNFILIKVINLEPKFLLSPGRKNQLIETRENDPVDELVNKTGILMLRDGECMRGRDPKRNPGQPAGKNGRLKTGTGFNGV